MDNTKYECTDCGWIGTDQEKAIINIDGWDCRACPKCENEEFYIAKNKESKKE